MSVATSVQPVLLLQDVPAQAVPGQLPALNLPSFHTSGPFQILVPLPETALTHCRLGSSTTPLETQTQGCPPHPMRGSTGLWSFLFCLGSPIILQAQPRPRGPPG